MHNHENVRVVLARSERSVRRRTKLVALVKIADYATVIPGVALFVLWVLVFLLAAMQSNFDSREVWERIQWAEAGAHPASAGNRMARTS